jgi:hypothetical protein
MLRSLTTAFKMMDFWEDTEGRKKNIEANFDDLLMCFDSCALDAMKYAKGVREPTLKDWREKLVGLKEKTLMGELISLKKQDFIILLANKMKIYFPEASKIAISHRLSELLNEFGLAITPGAIRRQWNRAA